jgi:hypothetical protein
LIIFFAALPPDVREVFDLPGADFPFSLGLCPMRAKLSCKLLKNGGINLSKTISILEGEINVTTRI